MVWPSWMAFACLAVQYVKETLLLKGIAEPSEW
jgi:hypothetical protein